MLARQLITLVTRLILLLALLGSVFSAGLIPDARAAGDRSLDLLSTPILDDFNRADGSLGANWNSGGATNITSNQVLLDDTYNQSVNSIWNLQSFGVDQEAFLTIQGLNVADSGTSVSLILKKQQADVSNGDMILVVYRHAQSHIQVYVVEGGSFADAKTPQSVSFANGDQFGVDIAGSTLRIYKNGTQILTQDVSSYDFVNSSGYIGFRYNLGGTDTEVVDDFGGGTMSTPATPTPTDLVSPTPTSTGLPTFTPTFTPSPLPTIPGGSSFPYTNGLDDFNRADGSVGSNWAGATAGHAISSNQVLVGAGGNIYWQPTAFGVHQEAFVTLTHIDPTTPEISLILKSQNNASSNPGQISVAYSPAAQSVQVWTHQSSTGWRTHGGPVPVGFADGDQLGARALSGGLVEIFKNGYLLATRSITDWGYYSQGGYIGLAAFSPGATRLDNFGGGTTTSVPSTPPGCTDPLTCNPVTSMQAHWICNTPGCTAAPWIGTVINWPSWAAYDNNAAVGEFSRTTYTPAGERLYPYMGPWADGCRVTAVSGIVLIVEWQRGSGVWRSTYLSAGESHTIDLIGAEDNVLLESPDTPDDFSVSLSNCTPQNIHGTSTPTSIGVPSVTASATNTPTSIPTNSPTATFTPSQTSTLTFTATAANTSTYTPTATNTATRTPTATFTHTPTSTNTATFTPTATNTATRTPTATLTSTFTPTRTPTNTYTPTFTATSTMTRTSTPTDTPVSAANLKVQLRSSGSDDTQRSDFYYRVVNTGTSPRSNISVRVYFTLDGSQPAFRYVLERWWDQSNAATVSGPVQASGSTYYFTVNYGSATLAAGSSWEFQTTLHLTDWALNFSGSNDWWHNTGILPSTYTDWTRIPVYVNGSLVWGSVPGGTAVPTFTPTRTPTQTATAAPVNRVTGFTLVNADTDADIRTLTNGETINLATLPTLNLNIRANTSPAAVGSVRFDYNGATSYRVENTVPYALASDNGSGNYNPWTPSVGQHTLSATTFSGINATGAASGPLTISFTVINTPPTATRTPAATATPAFSYHPLYLSLADGQTVGGVTAADEDILKFDGQTWSIFFDGSDVGASFVDVKAFSILDSNSILMSFSSSVTLNGMSVTPQDVVQFDATSLGSTTAGTFSMYLDGSDVGLTTADESIDSLDLIAGPWLLISTTGSASVTGVAASDEDVLAFSPSSLGSFTSGTWSIGFDGSDVGLGDTDNEDLDALDVVGGNTVYLSTVGDFAVSGVSGSDEDVFVCTIITAGNTTACTYSSALYFDGSTWALSANDIDAFQLLGTGP